MEASRKYDAIPSDRLVSEYDTRRERRADEAEAERYEVESMREQYARIVELLAQVRAVMQTTEQGWLYQQLANALGNFFEYAVDPCYRMRPARTPDVDAERERLILYASERQHNEDIRNAVRINGDPPLTDPVTGLFPWERGNG